MTFDQAMEFIFEQEGGYSNDSADPGGETRYGISQRQFPELDLQSLTRDQAKEIYRKQYWDACRCQDLPQSIRLAVFDCAVNQGAMTAIQLLQRVIGTVPDGVVGPKTLKAARNHSAHHLLVYFLSERMIRYARTIGFDRFGRGWTRRLFYVHSNSHKC